MGESFVRSARPEEEETRENWRGGMSLFVSNGFVNAKGHQNEETRIKSMKENEKQGKCRLSWIARVSIRSKKKRENL